MVSPSHWSARTRATGVARLAQSLELAQRGRGGVRGAHVVVVPVAPRQFVLGAGEAAGVLVYREQHRWSHAAMVSAGRLASQG